MLKIQGTRNYLYQWDLNQKVIIVDNDSVNEVHFVNEGQNDNALIVEVKEDSKARYAEIPNILLQSGDNILAYEHCEDNGEYTFRKYLLEVIRRPKPADYVYTETEIKSYEALQADLDKKIDAPQVAQVGEVLTVEEVGEDGKPVKWKTQTVETEPPDWNENDPTKLGYVKNRPLWQEVVNEPALPQTTIEYRGGMFRLKGALASPEKIEVIFDETKYECVEMPKENGISIYGNLALSDFGGEDTGEPFVIQLYGGVDAMVGTQTEEQHTIQINASYMIYHALDSAYMPKDITKVYVYEKNASTQEWVTREEVGIHSRNMGLSYRRNEIVYDTESGTMQTYSEMVEYVGVIVCNQNGKNSIPTSVNSMTTFDITSEKLLNKINNIGLNNNLARIDIIFTGNKYLNAFLESVENWKYVGVAYSAYGYLYGITVTYAKNATSATVEVKRIL